MVTSKKLFAVNGKKRKQILRQKSEELLKKSTKVKI